MTQRAADDFAAIAENMARIRKDREEAEKQRLARDLTDYPVPDEAIATMRRGMELAAQYLAQGYATITVSEHRA